MKKNQAAVELGSLGGKASAARLTKEQRIERATRAGLARKLKCECGRAECGICYHREYKRKWRATRNAG